MTATDARRVAAPELILTARSLYLDSVAAEVGQGLGGAGVRAILLKGASFAGWLYADGSPRPYDDIDLLVAPGARADAEAALRDLGFAAPLAGASSIEQCEHARVWVRGSVCVDLHHTLVGVGGSAATVWSVLSERTERVRVGGAPIEVLDPGGRTLVVALHAAANGPRHARPLDDLRRAVERLPVEVWRDATALARRLDATPAMAVGLRLVPEGAALAARLGLTDAGSLEARLRASTPPPLAEGLMRWARTPGWRSKARVAVRKVVPTPSCLRVWWPPAARSRRNLVVGYLWRPAYLALHTPRALGAIARLLPGFSWRAARWAMRAGACARADVRRGEIGSAQLPLPPASAAGLGSVRAVLRLRGDTCLVRSLVLQRWHAAHGERRDVVIGVRSPQHGFRAHAWLDGDPHDAAAGFVELARRPAP